MNEIEYRKAERLFWNAFGREPSERTIRLAGTGTAVRIQELGDGDPVVFIHGGPNSGSTWAPMIQHMAGLRCILVDRPGTGLSEQYAVRTANLPAFGSRFVPDLLDALGIDVAHVVASSFGGHLALRSAADHPKRVDRMVQMAAPALVPDATYPPFMTVLRSRVARRILGLLPPNDRAMRMIFRQLGHGVSLDSGRIPDALFEWYGALQRHTDTMRNEYAMIGDVVVHRDRVLLTEDVLGRVTSPTLFLWGADDGFGGEENAELVAGMMPDATVVMMPGAGHLPWLDDPLFVAERTRHFLAGVPPSEIPVSGSRSDDS